MPRFYFFWPVVWCFSRVHYWGLDPISASIYAGTSNDRGEFYWSEFWIIDGIQESSKAANKLGQASLLLPGTILSIVGPPLNKGGVGPSKNWNTWGDTKPLLERGITLKRGGGGDVEMGGHHFFITLQFNCVYCVFGGKIKFPLLHFGSSFFWVNHARFSSKSL